MDVRDALTALSGLLGATRAIPRGVGDWTTEPITLPPRTPTKIGRGDPRRLHLIVWNRTAAPAVLSPLPSSTMSGQGACLLRPFGERKVRTTADVWAYSEAGTVVDVVSA